MSIYLYHIGWGNGTWERGLICSPCIEDAKKRLVEQEGCKEPLTEDFEVVDGSLFDEGDIVVIADGD